MFSGIQKTMIGHGALIFLVGMLAGVGLLVSLLGGLELIPGKIQMLAIVGDPGTWAKIHVGGLLNGLFVMLIAVVAPGMGFEAQGVRRLAWAIIGTGWANTVFYWAALFAPNHALSFGPNRFGASNAASILGLAPALLFVVVAIIAMAAIARQAFRKSEA